MVSYYTSRVTNEYESSIEILNLSSVIDDFDSASRAQQGHCHRGNSGQLNLVVFVAVIFAAFVAGAF